MTIKIMRRLMPFMASAALSMSALTVHADYNLPDGVPNSFSSKANYTLFETVPVRPMTMSADGQHLYVLNTPR